MDRYVYTASLLFDCACKMKFQVAGCLALVAVACRSSETAADANAVVQVKLAVAAVQPFEDKVGSIGTVQVHSGHFASLSAPSPARITTIYVSVGQRVSRGTPLIAFEQTPFIAAAQSAEAALAAAQRAYDRARRLADAGIIPRKDVEQAAKDFAQANATALTASIPTADIAAAGTAQVTVANNATTPTAGLPFSIGNAPVITSPLAVNATAGTAFTAHRTWCGGDAQRG